MISLSHAGLFSMSTNQRSVEPELDDDPSKETVPPYPTDVLVGLIRAAGPVYVLAGHAWALAGAARAPRTAMKRLVRTSPGAPREPPRYTRSQHQQRGAEAGPERRQRLLHRQTRDVGEDHDSAPSIWCFHSAVGPAPVYASCQFHHS